MDKRLLECLGDQVPSQYILPFFWQHGEEHSLLLRELEAIYHCGIKEFCVESRPHPHFCQEPWWEDFGFLLEEAQKREMRVWLLDDKRFPTGYANGFIASHPELQAVRARLEVRDFVGPQPGAALVPPTLWEEERIVAILAYPRQGADGIITGEGISLLPSMREGLIWWDIPPGNWRVYTVVRTIRSPVKTREYYIDLMSSASCNAMIQAVYEPHYQHFRQYFGNTFAGFFSDEPGFSNEVGTYHATLGREKAFLPWRDSLPQELAEWTDLPLEQVILLLPTLWQQVEGASPILREAYMELVTEAFSKNFSWQLGDWCRRHGVEYIGHVIEDENAHQRLGHGCGHYFRALAGQDMAGVDIVLHQYIPGLTEISHTACLEEGKAEPAFFQYTLPRLASSLAHLQPLKKGRALCEIYGGFGWAEGIPEMKQMTDLMLVGGINYFVPHAFNPKFPDEDHPPHFYARGSNPQFAAFGKLMDYVKRMSHLLSGGLHQADVAVYYNAEAEWSGGSYQLQQEVCKVLAQGQVEFDLVPQDVLCEEGIFENDRLCLNEVTYGALVVPYSQFLPWKVLKAMASLADRGFPVLFLEALPQSSSQEQPVEKLLHACQAVSIQDLLSLLKERGLSRFSLEKTCPWLRTFRLRRENWDVIMLWNESLSQQVDTWIQLPGTGQGIFYDGWRNRLFSPQQNGKTLRIKLAPMESLVIVMGPWEQTFQNFEYADTPGKSVSLDWNIDLKEWKGSWVSYRRKAALGNLAPELPRFSGVIRYESCLETEEPEDIHTLDFGQAGEIVQLWVNGEDCGTIVGQPCRFDVAGKLRKGCNQLRADVIPNLAYGKRDRLSSYVPLPIMGLQGPVVLR